MERSRVNPFESGPSGRTYSIGEAQAFSRAQIEYCDRMEAQYPDAIMASLRLAAVEFLYALEHEPLDWEQVEAQHGLLRAGMGVEGSGWLSLLNYVTHFIGTNHADGGG